MDLFFYGTLMDLDVLSRVTGRPFTADALLPATLTGWRRVRALGEPYPIVLPEPGGVVQGVVVRDLTEADVAKLSHYEGTKYDLVPADAEIGGKPHPVRFYRPGPAFKADPEPWVFENWLKDEKAAFLVRITDRGFA